MASFSRILLATPRRASMLRRHSSALVATTLEFPELPAITPEPKKASTPSVSTLSNGLVVVTEGSSSTSTVTITFPGAGSTSEMTGESGAALLSKGMNFKSGSGLSSLLIMRSLEDKGAVPLSSASRTSATIGYTCAPENAAYLAPLLATDCAFEAWDLKAARDLAQIDIDEALSSPQVTLSEAIFAASFGDQSSMGKPFFSADASNDAVKDFRTRSYGLKGAVLAATGVEDHAAFCTAVEEELSESPVGEGVSPISASPYVGTTSRIHAPGMGFANVALAVEGPDSLVMGNIVKKALELMGSSAFAAHGLVGVFGSAPTEEAGALVDSLLSTLGTSASADIVKRAKSLAKAEAVFATESGSVAMAEAMTQGVLDSSTFSGVGASYDAVPESQVTAALSTVLGGPKAMAAVGDLSNVPYSV